MKSYIGTPPGYTSYSIDINSKEMGLEIYGSVNPVTLVVNGKMTTLQEQKNINADHQYVVVNGERLTLAGKQGSFYKKLKFHASAYSIQIHTKKKVYTATIKKNNYFFNRSYKKQWLIKGTQQTFNWQGKLGPVTEVFLNNQKLVKDEYGFVSIPIPLIKGVHSLSLQVIEPDKVQVFGISYTVNISNYRKNEPYALIEEGSLNLNFNKNKFKFKTSENIELSFLGDKKISQGQVSFTYKPDCLAFPQDTLLGLKYKDNVKQKKLNLESSDCELYKSKLNSRVYIAYGAGHVGFIDSIDSEIDLMYSRHINPGPRFALGLRLYKKLYFEVRGLKTQSFHNSDGDYAQALGGGYFSMGYPYRGKYFMHLGVINLNVGGYRMANSSNFNGLVNNKVTGFALEIGRRWDLSPSFSLNSRLFYTAPFMSFHSHPHRRWTFLILEPLVLEYYF